MAVTHDLPPTRDGADRCPGVLTLHEAADGGLARVRIPGGMLSPQTLVGLAELSARCAAGGLDLTARGNVQLRGVRDDRTLAAGLHALGLLPSVAHDRARNLATSPLAGLDPDREDTRPLVAALDERVTASPGLAELPGRFVISVDDGSGRSPVGDAGLWWRDGWRLQLAGLDCGPGTADDVVDAAKTFLCVRGSELTCWRMRDLAGGAAPVARLLGRTTGERIPARPERLPLGPMFGGRVSVAAVWLQHLTLAQAQAVAAATAVGETVRLAPAGRLVVPVADATAAGDLRTAGLLTDADDPRAQVTTCSGLGACARATTDVHALAALEAGVHAGPRHLVACPRGCGRPDDATLDIR